MNYIALKIAGEIFQSLVDDPGLEFAERTSDNELIVNLDFYPDTEFGIQGDFYYYASKGLYLDLLFSKDDGPQIESGGWNSLFSYYTSPGFKTEEFFLNIYKTPFDGSHPTLISQYPFQGYIPRIDPQDIKNEILVDEFTSEFLTFVNKITIQDIFLRKLKEYEIESFNKQKK